MPERYTKGRRSVFKKMKICSRKVMLFSFIICILISVSVLRWPLFGVLSIQSFLGEPWEKSLPSDFLTCSEIVSVLIKEQVNEGDLSSKIFSWKTPKFVNLLSPNQLLNLTAQQRKLTDVICTGVSNDFKPNILIPNTVCTASNQPCLSDVDQTSFEILTKTGLKVGDNISLEITTKDRSGSLATLGGGDFFKVRAEDPTTGKYVAASAITYKGEGVYHVDIKTFWLGRHNIKIFFGQSGHFVDVVKRITSQFHGIGSTYKGEYGKSNKKNDRTVTGQKQTLSCHVNSTTLDPHTSYCDYSGEKGEEWYCEKPEMPLSCIDLHSVYSRRRKNFLSLVQIFPLFDRGTLKRKHLNGLINTVNVASTTEKNFDTKLPKCGPGLTTPSPSGYWLNGKWISRVCQNFHYSSFADKMKQCLTNRVFYFIGDSTIRQWFEYFVYKSNDGILPAAFSRDPFQAKEITSAVDVWEPRTAVIEDINTTFHYRSHGQPLQNGGLYYATKFISAQLDEIPALNDKGAHITIVFAIGPHFLLYNPDLYLRRILATQKAALTLLSRNPKMTIIFKGPNTFIRGLGIGECCLSDWLSFRQHHLAKSVFDGTPIIYLDVWDMTVSHNSEDLVHPVREVIKSELDMALSFTCLRKS